MIRGIHYYSAELKTKIDVIRRGCLKCSFHREGSFYSTIQAILRWYPCISTNKTYSFNKLEIEPFTPCVIQLTVRLGECLISGQGKIRDQLWQTEDQLSATFCSLMYAIWFYVRKTRLIIIMKITPAQKIDSKVHLCAENLEFLCI